MRLTITRAKGFHVGMDNGITLSVQIGPGNYCENYDEEIGAERDPKYRLPPSSTAEIAAWINGGEMIELQSGDTVDGYVPVSHVLAAIPALMALKAPDAQSVRDVLSREVQP